MGEVGAVFGVALSKRRCRFQQPNLERLGVKRAAVMIVTWQHSTCDMLQFGYLLLNHAVMVFLVSKAFRCKIVSVHP